MNHSKWHPRQPCTQLSSAWVCNSSISVVVLALQSEGWYRKLLVLSQRYMALYTPLDIDIVCGLSFGSSRLCSPYAARERQVGLEIRLGHSAGLHAYCWCGGVARWKHSWLDVSAWWSNGSSIIADRIPSLGAVYNAGYYKMSTWIPFTWAWINVVVLILSSFSFQGGL